MIRKMTLQLDTDKIDGIIFDLDGTLWDTTERICESWNLILNKHTEIKRGVITREDLTGCMGLPMYDIAAKLFPDEEVSVRNALMDELCIFENGYLAKKGGVLYEGMEDTLMLLGQKYPLFIVSNCQDGYIEAFLTAHNMKKYFKDTECWGRTRVSKGESNKILMERNNLKHPVYVGDTAGDAKSAADAGIPFIFAAYGFGSVDDYSAKVDDIRDLVDFL